MSRSLSSLLPTLLALLPILFTLFISYRYGLKVIPMLTNKDTIKPTLEIYTVKWFIKTLGLVLFFANMIIIILETPQAEKPVPYDSDGRDIVFLVDISNSMLSKDILPSRLERSLSIIQGICDQNQESRFGVVVFKGKGITIIPITEDLVSVKTFLSYIRPEAMTAPGTNITSGFRQALSTFLPNQEREKHIVMFTDGGDMEGELNADVIDSLKNQNINLLIIGAGTSQGGTIPLSQGETLKNAKGEDVITAMNVNYMEHMANESAGTLLYLEDPLLLNKINEQWDSKGADSTSRGYIMVRKDAYHIYLLFAILGLCLYHTIRLFRWKGIF